MENIKVGKYIVLNESEKMKYDVLFEHVRPSDTLLGKKAVPLMNMTYGEVSFIQHKVSDVQLVFEKIWGIDRHKFLDLKVADFFPCVNWVKEQLKALAEANKKLETEADPKMEEAGIKELERFGSLNALISIAKDYGVTPQEVETWKYSFVFTLLYHSVISSTIERNYSKIQ